MTIKKMAWLSVVPGLLLAASTVAASPNQPAPRCSFQEFSPVAVAAYNTDEDFGLGAYTRLRGAQIFVAAKPGLTAEWLSLQVQQEIGKLNNSCRPSVNDVQVSVVSAGSGFWVMLSAKSEREAAAVLKWARSMSPAGIR